MMKNWTVKPTVRYLPAVIAIGIALGVASHAIGFESGLVESVILHTITALLIGSGLIFVVTNADLVSPESSESIRSIIFGLLFMVIGVVVLGFVVVVLVVVLHVVHTSMVVVYDLTKLANMATKVTKGLPQWSLVLHNSRHLSAIIATSLVI